MEVTKILRIICLQAQTVTGDPLPISNFGKTHTQYGDTVECYYHQIKEDKQAAHVTCIRKKKNANKIYIRKHEEKSHQIDLGIDNRVC
jgi:hypothetical protein